MSDPVTIGLLAAQALALAAPEVLKTTVSEATKDAYKKLKGFVAHWAGAEVAALEAAPASKGKQLVLAEVIDAQPDAERENLRAAVQVLLFQLKTDAPNIGLDIGVLRHVETQLGAIKVAGGVGVRVQEVEGGSFRTGDISVGESSGN